MLLLGYPRHIRLDVFSTKRLGWNDQIATAWANGLALISDGAYGYYTDGHAINFNPNDMTPNVGTDWEFREVEQNSLYYANWGELLATIHETKRHNADTNVVFKYFHTWQGLSYSVSFSGSGPSISISPTTSQQSTVVYTHFTD